MKDLLSIMDGRDFVLLKLTTTMNDEDRDYFHSEVCPCMLARMGNNHANSYSYKREDYFVAYLSRNCADSQSYMIQHI